MICHRKFLFFAPHPLSAYCSTSYTRCGRILPYTTYGSTCSNVLDIPRCTPLKSVQADPWVLVGASIPKSAARIRRHRATLRNQVQLITYVDRLRRFRHARSPTQLVPSVGSSATCTYFRFLNMVLSWPLASQVCFLLPCSLTGYLIPPRDLLQNLDRTEYDVISDREPGVQAQL